MSNIILTPLFLNGISASGQAEGFESQGIKARIASTNPSNAGGTQLFYTRENELGERVYEVAESMATISGLLTAAEGSQVLDDRQFVVDNLTTWSIPHGTGRPIYWSFIDTGDNDLTASISRDTDDGNTAVFSSITPLSGIVYYH